MSRNRERRYDRWTRCTLATLAVVYLAVAVERERVMGRGELYPFAAWSLFSMVPNTSVNYSLRLTAVDGEAIPPVYFDDARAYVRGTREHNAWMTISELGHAIERDNRPAIAAARERLEEVYLRRAGVEYEVVRRHYDPLERWRGGGFDRVEVLARFRSGDSP